LIISHKIGNINQNLSFKNISRKIAAGGYTKIQNKAKISQNPFCKKGTARRLLFLAVKDEAATLLKM